MEKDEHPSPIHRPVLFKRIHQLRMVMSTKQLFEWIEYGEEMIKNCQ